MSGSYRLQASRPRHVPSPLRFDEPSFTSSSVKNPQGAQTLLYDLPPTTSVTPPASPQSQGRLISPTSPTFSTRTRRGVPTPPVSGKSGSSAPPVAPSQLETFAVHCRAWYFHQDEESGRQMTQTLSTLPPAQRAPFARLQASIRADYHRSVNSRKNAEFQAHITAMQPGGSLSAHSRANCHGSLAKKERRERVRRFIIAWCTVGMPGTQPFFEALWAVFRLQVLPENLGGAGHHRIEWEFDDAVLKESAGREFMFEATDVLKGVLAFEEIPSSKKASKANGFYPESGPIHLRSQSQPLSSDQKAVKINSTVQPKRARAPSDPFLDTPHSAGFASPQASDAATALLGVGAEEHSAVEDSNLDDDEDYMRIWTSPDISNPELLELLKLFPSFVSRRPLPRFPRSDPRHPDIEEGEEEASEGKRVHFGTGSMWVSSKPRNTDWNGGWWIRFTLWLRRLFSC